MSEYVQALLNPRLGNCRMICVLVGRFGMLNLGSMEVFKTDSLLIAQEFQERKKRQDCSQQSLAAQASDIRRQADQY